MTRTLRTDDLSIEITLRRVARARRMSLRVSRLDGRVTLTAPHGVPERQLRDFANDRADWIRAAVAQALPPVAVVAGACLPIAGREHAVVAGKTRTAKVVSQELVVPVDRPGRAARAYLRHLARDKLAAASDSYAARIGREVARITLRDTRSRWGSCSRTGGLMYSWRLAMAPDNVLDYVAAHEVAHLVHMDHSPRFWGLVAELFPGHEAARAWLKTHGTALHRYRFDD